MTPDEIDAIYEQACTFAERFDRTKGTYRELWQGFGAIMQPLLEYAESGGQNAQLAFDAYNMACSFNDADGLYTEPEHLDRIIAEHKAELRARWSS